MEREGVRDKLGVQDWQTTMYKIGKQERYTG